MQSENVGALAVSGKVQFLSDVLVGTEDFDTPAVAPKVLLKS
jgi:hypothetical protein